jgi:solute carrier family 45 protein 3
VLQAPKQIKQLFWADLFCWMGVMGQMMYITDYMAKVVYQGSPDAVDGSKEDILFEQGVRMGSFGMLLHSLVGMEQLLFHYFRFY